MAQVFVPDNPREREQLEGGVGVSDRLERPQRKEYSLRRFGTIDFIVILAIIAAVSLLVLGVSRWATPLSQTFTINLSPSALPAYAGYSLLRMILGYLLSLVFTLIYGQIAATHRRAEMIMLPLLDILQSIPILSFLPTVILLLVALFPNSNVGLELSSVIFIFTSMAWNMTFSFYHSARALPSDLKEVATISRLRPWQRFVRLVVPASMIGLIWNSMMSWAGGWFFLMASEQFTLGSHSYELPGLGSYLQAAANAGDVAAIFFGLLTLVLLIVLLDFVFWRPLVAWADKFKVEQSAGADEPTSFMLNIIRRSAFIVAVDQKVFRPIGSFLARILNRLQPLPKTDVPVKMEQTVRLTPRRIVNMVFTIVLIAFVLLGIWSALKLLVQVNLATWGTLLLAAFVTWFRTLVAILIGVVWTVPAGVAIGLSPRWSRRLQPVVQVVASIPATAVFPVLLLVLISLPAGLNIAAILLMLLGTQWYILFNVIAGAMAIPSDLREATTVYHVLSWRRWRTLILPGIFPYLVTGLLTASGGAWNASIVSEFVQFGGQTHSIFGLGATIAESAASANYPVLLAGTLMMSAFVVLINRLVWKRMYSLAERRFTLA